MNPNLIGPPLAEKSGCAAPSKPPFTMRTKPDAGIPIPCLEVQAKDGRSPSGQCTRCAVLADRGARRLAVAEPLNQERVLEIVEVDEPALQLRGIVHLAAEEVDAPDDRELAPVAGAVSHGRRRVHRARAMRAACRLLARPFTRRTVAMQRTRFTTVASLKIAEPPLRLIPSSHAGFAPERRARRGRAPTPRLDPPRCGRRTARRARTRRPPPPPAAPPRGPACRSW